jgi:hypothetical protein
MLAENAGLNPWIGLPAGAATGAIVAVLLGLPSLRLAGIYIALLTLAFYEVLGPLLTVGQAIGTGGKRGISPITPYSHRRLRRSPAQSGPLVLPGFGVVRTVSDRLLLRHQLALRHQLHRPARLGAVRAEPGHLPLQGVLAHRGGIR